MACRWPDLTTQEEYIVLKYQTTCLCALLLLASAAHAQEQRGGTWKAVTGDVRVSQGLTQRVAEVGGGVQQADHIVTGRDASATFMLKDGTVVSVGPNATLDLAQVQFDSTTQNGNLALSLMQGTVRIVTGWLGKLHPEQVKVFTPTSVVGVRGTDFVVEVP